MGKRVLDTIDSPEDLKKLSVVELERLAGEIRSEIIETVLERGGHLASNLGVVELTIALHYCFDFLKDRLIWDVGHQCYTHKILTGRKELFRTLRKQGGLSGFPSPSESAYDLFLTGHSGTSISSGLGLACGDELHSIKRKTVVVIGDGAISSGMPFEGLFHAGELRKDLLIILNDNEMAISRTVGALSRYFARIRTMRSYEEAKRMLHDLLRRFGRLGAPLEHAIEHIKDGIRETIGVGGIFSELGFRYFGPCDGHDLPGLLDIIGTLRELPGPIMLHIVTQKGKGYQPASTFPDRYHSATPLNKIEPLSSSRTYTSFFSEKVVELAEKDERIVAITAAMPEGTGLALFRERFPTRYFDVGMCEQHAIGFAGGLSRAGLLPLVAIYSTFLQRAYDQIFHDLALQGFEAVLAIDRAGLVGADGPTHHGVFDISYLRHIPNIVLCAPKDGKELGKMLEFAIESGQLVAIRYPRDSSPSLGRCPPIQLGKGEVIVDGDEIALVAYGAMVGTALRVAELLQKHGIRSTVVNARFAKPLDVELLLYLARTHPLMVTLEDHILAGGFGSAVLELLSEHGDTPERLLRLGIPDRFIEHGSRTELLRSLGLDPPSIVRRVLESLREPERVR